MGVIFVSLGLHEYAHAKLADSAGDPTPRMYGRVTLNILKHLDPLGTVMIVLSSLAGFGIGWGKPVPMDPRKMKNPRWDFFAAVAAGPITNFFIAVFFGFILQALISSELKISIEMARFLIQAIYINLFLCFFNLIPIGPLDGQHLVGTLLPDRLRYQWVKWNMLYGGNVLIAIIVIGQMTGNSFIMKILEPMVRIVFKFITGIS